MTGRRSRTRFTRGEQAAIGAGLVGLLVLVMALQIGRADAERDLRVVRAAAAVPAPTVTVMADPAPVVTAAPPVTDPTDAALAVKPLRDLVPGDRVVYTPAPGGPGVVCAWTAWGGDIAVSTIACGDEPPFDVPTGTLGPVEPRPQESAP